MEVPAVSVIIPMYNTEKYIGECLDSLLAQTFKNYEVIVVDDCSTDSSVEIVESYLEKFDGRLQIFKTEKNSGGGGYVPRNLGLEKSCGKYIFFIDSDDFIEDFTLEELFLSAENAEADVVYLGAYYSYNEAKESKLVFDDEGKHLRDKKIEDIPTLTVENPAKNLDNLIIEDGNFRNPWTRFILREFLIENGIKFPEVVSGGDYIWTIEVYCHAKRFLRIPYPFYFYRNYSTGSVSRKKRSAAEQNLHWVSAFIYWLQALEALSNKTEILKDNPQYGYITAVRHFNYCLNCFFGERMQLPSKEIYEILYKGLAEKNISSAMAIPFFFSVIDSQQKDLINLHQKYKDLALQSKKLVIDLKNEVERLKG